LGHQAGKFAFLLPPPLYGAAWEVRAVKRIILAGLLAMGGPAFADDHVIAQGGRAFHPGEITINRGDSLTFTNQDDFIHQVFVSGLFDSDEKAPGQKLTESFPQTGTFEVRCHIHPKMKLLVHVK
jgi:plastocyanin